MRPCWHAGMIGRKAVQPPKACSDLLRDRHPSHTARAMVSFGPDVVTPAYNDLCGPRSVQPLWDSFVAREGVHGEPHAGAERAADGLTPQRSIRKSKTLPAKSQLPCVAAQGAAGRERAKTSAGTLAVQHLAAAFADTLPHLSAPANLLSLQCTDPEPRCSLSAPRCAFTRAGSSGVLSWTGGLDSTAGGDRGRWSSAGDMLARDSSFDDCALIERMHSRTRAMRDSSRTSTGWAMMVRSQPVVVR